MYLFHHHGVIGLMIRGTLLQAAMVGLQRPEISQLVLHVPLQAYI
jgi:hypothetical protein